MERELGIANVYQVERNLFAIDEIGRTILYVYAGSKRVLLIDTGFGLLDLVGLVKELCPNREILVVNTHAHGDHNSGNGQFDCVHVGKRDAELCRHDMEAETRRQFYEHFLANEPKLTGWNWDGWHPTASKQVVELSDGDVLDLGGVQLEVMETPGHTIGSVCLLDRQNGYLFSGDMMLTWPVWGQLRLSAPLSEYGASLHRIAGYAQQLRAIFPAHGKADNPLGWPLYHLEPYVAEVYDRGVQNILAGKMTGKPYTCFLESGLCAEFAVGGMVYNPERL